MIELPGKARPWFASTGRNTWRHQPPATGTDASVCSRQARMVLDAHEYIRGIAKQRATFLHPQGTCPTGPSCHPVTAGERARELLLQRPRSLSLQDSLARVTFTLG